MRLFHGLTVGGLVAALACGGGDDRPAAAEAPRDEGSLPRLSEVWQIATHNSYWVDRGVAGDLYAGGTRQRLLDQLLAEGARSVEIDIHPDEALTGAFRVYHTEPGNTLCSSLDECLAILRAFHRALPRHEPVTIVLELKQIFAATFGPGHGPAELDAVLTRELGAALFRPADLLARCPGEASLSACVRGARWPRLDALRGRFVVVVLGNWDALGGQATRDWVDYATGAPIGQRAAFPMASSWKLDRATLPPPTQEIVQQSELDAALAQSVFLQVEDAADPRLDPFLSWGGVVRIDNAFTPDAQSAAVARGVQIVQTDEPWVRADDRGVDRPVHPLAPGADLIEPGARLLLQPAGEGELVFASADVPATATTVWESTVAAGRDGASAGCLRAASDATAAPQASVSLCRRKVSGLTAADQGGGSGTPSSERLVVEVERCEAGACERSEVDSDDNSQGGPGEILSLRVEPGAQGGSCVVARSARLVDASLAPLWSSAAEGVCVSAPLVAQGLARTSPAGAQSPVLFFATTRDGAPAQASAFAQVAALPASGAARADASLLVDRSAP